jgi:cardiolipin synthase
VLEKRICIAWIKLIAKLILFVSIKNKYIAARKEQYDFLFPNSELVCLLSKSYATRFELLGKKAKEGVEIRAIFDAFGNFSNNQPLKKKHLKEIRAKGIEIVKFDPLRFPWINHVFHRDHRKIVVIDGEIGYTGGMNIADYYIEGLPEIGDWRDMHIRIEGTAVNELQDIFLDMWNKCTKQGIGGTAYYPLKKDSIKSSLPLKNVAIVDRYPRKNPKVMREVYAHAIENAENKILIINPYFTPTKTIKRAIKKAVKKGTKVEIMIPGKSDIGFTPDAALYTANQLRKKGADIYIYNGGFHHSKIMMVDSLYCTVGSTNLNSRSLHYDYEVNAFVFDKETTHELIQMFQEDKEDSTLLTADMYKKRTPWKKFIGWFAHLFTPFL